MQEHTRRSPSAFNPLCIETPGTDCVHRRINNSFQSSLHWDRCRLYHFTLPAIYIFQSSLHWDMSIAKCWATFFIKSFNPLCIETTIDERLSSTKVIFQSSLHWDSRMKTGNTNFRFMLSILFALRQVHVSWEAKLKGQTFNPLCIETSTVNNSSGFGYSIFQSSLHWDLCIAGKYQQLMLFLSILFALRRDSQKIGNELGYSDFQSSLHWDVDALAVGSTVMVSFQSSLHWDDAIEL